MACITSARPSPATRHFMPDNLPGETSVDHPRDLGGEQVMNESHEADPVGDSDVLLAGEIGRGVRPALACLAQARRYAESLSLTVWDFAVEFETLLRLDVSANDLRWCVAAGLVDHANETTATDGQRRSFVDATSLSFGSRTCFALSPTGVRMAGAFEPVEEDAELPAPAAVDRQPTVKPVWDAERRQLSVDGVVVKHFKLPSPNQVTILSTFQEDGWPYHIDDPLPACPTVSPKERLRYTIKSLNKYQKHRLIRFCGDGRGEGICWELRGEALPMEDLAGSA